MKTSKIEIAFRHNLPDLQILLDVARQQAQALSDTLDQIENFTAEVEVVPNPRKPKNAQGEEVS